MKILSSKTSTRAIIFAAVLLLLSVTLPAQGPKTRTESGTISGAREDSLRVYKGVPFAAPPVGELRWRAPAPVASWSGVRKAVAFAPACMQTGVSMPGEVPPRVSEDC